MFLGRKNKYCENDYTRKHNLQIQCNPYQITNDIFHRTRTKNFTIHMETQKAKAVLRKKNGAGRINLPDFSFYHNTFTTYCHKDSMVLAQKQKYRPMEQDRKPINKLMHLWVPYFRQRRQEYTMRKRQPLQ